MPEVCWTTAGRGREEAAQMMVLRIMMVYFGRVQNQGAPESESLGTPALSLEPLPFLCVQQFPRHVPGAFYLRL